MTLFIWNGDPVLLVGCARLVGGLLDRLAVTSGVLDISDIMQPFDYEKSSIISQLIKGKLKDLEKLLNYFIQTTTSVSNALLLLSGLLQLYLSYM